MAECLDGELVAAALRGETDGYMRLCRRHYAAAVAVALAVLHDEHSAEDVAQDTFAKAIRMLPTLRDGDRFRPWLLSICRNLARDTARRPRPPEPLGDREPADPKSRRQDTVDAVREAIERLPARDREVLLLRYQANLSYEELSASLGLSEQAVNGRLRRAREALRRLLLPEARR